MSLAGRRIRIRGTVQGVGFRPWVYRIAREAGLGGRVRNDPQGVTIEAFGPEEALVGFLDRLRSEAPPPARVRELHATTIPGEATDGFVIDASGTDGGAALSIPPDLATCPDCEREVLDAGDRRHGYPFTNCTHCGPRFTIATAVPYDRPATTMAAFTMCPACAREYAGVDDRRFHAQPNACPVCGPQLRLLASTGAWMPVLDPLEAAAELLRAGEIVAVKGLGGFHLACDATRPAAVAALRLRKQRDQKPFAVMVRDLAAARELAEIDDVAAALLTGAERPIVLLRDRPGSPIAAEVAPLTDLIGLLLPYTPLHHLLLHRVGRPLVMTSANLADEPICRTNEEAVARLAYIADALLVHDRDIANRCDDSVARVIGGQGTLLRRSRGWVPRPIALARPLAHPVLACGGQLKNTFCLAAGDTAYLGPHIGDLDTPEALAFLDEAIDRMERLLRISPEVVAHDLHPDYLSTRYALSRGAPMTIGVQHHHAHVASAMAEHGLAGPVIGIAYDGTGWGPDATSWGGEVLVAGFDEFHRIASFRPIALAGGDTAIREVWRIALALLDDAFDGEPPLDRLALFHQVPLPAQIVVRRMIRGGFNAPLARGIGRYFDAFGALGLGLSTSAYEGQVAVAWNQVADAGEHGDYPIAVLRSNMPWEIDPRPMVRAAVDDLIDGAPAGVVSARFHETLIHVTCAVIRATTSRLGRLPVVLSGGAFAHPRLAEGVRAALAGDVDVRLHRDVPPGDGGIALGQAVVADALARRRS
ncbi:MAG TPA: carbamoyltransferase HypF [Kofleriaceae bacterium]|nr:carbamoyltransferase HypF [Kofleriaceae bacterium]